MFNAVSMFNIREQCTFEGDLKFMTGTIIIISAFHWCCIIVLVPFFSYCLKYTYLFRIRIYHKKINAVVHDWVRTSNMNICSDDDSAHTHVSDLSMTLVIYRVRILLNDLISYPAIHKFTHILMSLLITLETLQWFCYVMFCAISGCESWAGWDRKRFYRLPIIIKTRKHCSCLPPR